jgi:hypothetical protein
MRRRVFLNVPYDHRADHRVDLIEIAVVAAKRYVVMDGDIEPKADTDGVQQLIQAMTLGDMFIHDLSRDVGEGMRRVARMNNPMEVGLALGIERCSATTRRTATSSSPTRRPRPQQHLVLTEGPAPLDELLGNLRGEQGKRPVIYHECAVPDAEVPGAVLDFLLGQARQRGARARATLIEKVRKVAKEYPASRARHADQNCILKGYWTPGMTTRFLVAPAKRRNIIYGLLQGVL